MGISYSKAVHTPTSIPTPTHTPPAAEMSSTLRESDGLFQVHPAQSRQRQCSLDIVFVHGLGGDSYTTWTKDTTHWPKDLLPTLECFENARILTFGYNTSGFFTKNADEHRARTFTCAEILVSDLKTFRRRGAQDRPIIFVGHSLGGLVIKSALRHAILRRALYGDIVDSTRAIIFFSTPHQGTSQEAWKAFFARLGESKIEKSSVISELEVWSDMLTELTTEFADLATQIKITSFYERRFTKGVMIVPEAVAKMGQKNEQSRALDTDHLDICRFTETDANWRTVSNHLDAIVADIEDLAELQNLPPLSTQVANDASLKQRFESLDRCR
ncbi:Alpha/Beta hydrolase protein [Aspergillus pseudoustus]|uniref:Alpha/Beta hydrolase protein n=1 Tax=Aspergillus pseudoustus TaxID=1810923 RepID=A0ABR4J3N7_9EURO